MKKKQTILRLIQLILGDNKAKCHESVIKFKLIASSMDTKKRFFSRMLSRKANTFRQAYEQLKSLPYQQAKKLKSKATLFEANLNNILLGRLKAVH